MYNNSNNVVYEQTNNSNNTDKKDSDENARNLTCANRLKKGAEYMKQMAHIKSSLSKDLAEEEWLNCVSEQMLYDLSVFYTTHWSIEMLKSRRERAVPRCGD